MKVTKKAILLSLTLSCCVLLTLFASVNIQQDEIVPATAIASLPPVEEKQPAVYLD